jgi:hypothetical protein
VSLARRRDLNPSTRKTKMWEKCKPVLDEVMAAILDEKLIVIRRTNMRELFNYNIHSGIWRKYVIPAFRGAPPFTILNKPVVIGSDLYVFGGRVVNLNFKITNDLWKLTYDRNGRFIWEKISLTKQSQTPSPRHSHTLWEYEGKLLSFGGEGISHDGFLHDHGELNIEYGIVGNNQLVSFDPKCGKWRNPQCFGVGPSAESSVYLVSARINNIVYVFQKGVDVTNSLYQLDLPSLYWTQITTGQPGPCERINCSFTAISDTHIVLHGGARADEDFENINDTWVLDIPSRTWSEHSTQQDDDDKYAATHTALKCPQTNTLYILGGYENWFDQIRLDATSAERVKSLRSQSLACADIHREQLDFQALPKIFQQELLLPGEKAATVGQRCVWNGRMRPRKQIMK